MLSPATLDREGPITAPVDVVEIPWLNNQDSAWDGWLRAAGVAEMSCVKTRRFTLDLQLHLGRAALAGDGVALLNPRFFRMELATGSLIQPFDLVWRPDGAYWLVYPQSRRNRPVIRAFQRFMQAEVEAENAALVTELQARARAQTAPANLAPAIKAPSSRRPR